MSVQESGPWDDFKPQAASADDGPWNDWQTLSATTPAPEKSGLARRALGDTAVTALRSAIAVPEAAVGLADIVTGGRAGKAIQDIGVDFKRAKDIAGEWYSPEQQQANRNLQEAQGFGGKLAAAWENPSATLHTVGESVGPMLAGGAVARGIGVGGALLRGAIGEGAVSAGMSAEGMRQETPDGLLTPKQSAAAVGSGVTTGLITRLSGGLAQKLGIGDIDTALAGGVRAETGKGVARRVGEGILSEGVMEEMPQSAQEQMWQNFAADKPLTEGVPESMAMGLVTGGIMGGGFNALPNRQPQVDPNAGPLSRAAATAQQTGAAQAEQARQAAEQATQAKATTAPSQANAEAENAAREAFMRDTPVPPAGNFGAMNEFADLIAQERADVERLRNPAPFEEMKGVDAGFDPMTRARNQVPSASGSFGQMNEFADLLSQEQADVTQQRAGIAERQGVQRESRMESIAGDIEAGRQRQSEEARRSLLDTVLNDPETQNPLPRFESMLKKQGYAQRRATPEERQAIERFQSASTAFADMDREQAAPNEMDAAAMGIRERAPKVKQESPKPRAAFPMSREGAERHAAQRMEQTGQAFEVVPHPTVKDRFAVQAASNTSTEGAADQEQMSSADPRREPASWVIRNKATGESVMETFDRKKVDALNTEKYEAVPIMQHLQQINAAAQGAANAPITLDRAGQGDVATAFDREGAALAAQGETAEDPDIQAQAAPEVAAEAGEIEQVAPFDHGILNLPLSKRMGDIDAQLDRYKQDQAAQAKATAKADAAQRKTDKARAKELFALHGEAMVRQYGSSERLQSLGGAKAVRGELDQMVKWEPAKFNRLAEKFAAEQEQSANGTQADQALESQPSAPQEAAAATGPQADADEGVARAPEPQQAAQEASQASRPQAAQEGGATESGQGVGKGRTPRSLISLIQQSGGINSRLVADITGERTARTARAPVGLFRSTGMGVDMLAEVLQQNDFLTQADIDNVMDNSGGNAAVELVRRALSGERITSIQDREAEMAQAEERAHQSKIKQEASDAGIKTAFRRFEDIERDVMAKRDADAGDLAYEGYDELTPPARIAVEAFEELSEADAMAALGFTQEEINEALGQSQGRETTAGSAPARTEGQGGNDHQEAFGLSTQTNEEIAQREAAQKAAEQREQAEQQERERKAKADAERGSFALTGSDRAADVQAAQGQGGLFDAPTAQAGQSTPAESANPQAQQGEGADIRADKIQFSKFVPDAFDARQYAEAVDRIAAAETAPRTDLTVGDTPAVLRALGARALPVQMPSSLIHKASRPELRDHDVPVEVLRNLPALLADPVMVFDSQTEAGALVALVDAKDASGRSVVVAIHLDTKGSGFHNINRISSIYGKDDVADIGRWMNGSLRYYSKEKAPGWLRAVGLQLPEANTIKRLNPSVLTESDVVKAQRSFAGESARTADTHALAAAQQRIASGEDAETVRQETGWHKGADGKWRFEIDDSDARLLPALQSLRSGGFKAKPIASITYRQRDDGTFDITLNPPSPKETGDFVTLQAISESAARAVLPDSVFAAVERNEGAEDFIGNFEDAKRIESAFEFDGFNALPLDQAIHHPALFAAYPALRDVMVQVDPKLGFGGAFAFVDHADGTTSQVIRVGNAQQLSTLLHEIQHGIQSVEGFASGGSINDEIKAAHAILGGASPVKGKTLEQYAFDRYERNAGETEARNTQARQKLTAAERRATSPESTADVKASAVIVVFNGREMANAPAPANAQRAQTGTTPDAIRSAIASLVGPLRTKRIVVVQSADELVSQGILTAQEANGAQAFVKDGKAYFIADAIRPGNERAVFLHEVGAHLGLEKILSPLARKVLLTRIRNWAKESGTLESRIAKAALRRVEAAGETGSESELLAYMVEEAVKAGINPTVETAGPIGQWFRQFMAHVRAALEKLGLISPKQLTAQDVVDLAKGAAGVALEQEGAENNDVSPSDARIQFSRAASAIGAVWDVPESSKLFNRFDTDSLLYTLQDKHIDTKRVVEAIRKQSGDIADEFNPYLQEELFHGRSAKGVKDFLDNELRPLLTEMSLRKIGMGELEDYLHARHAEERNIQIAKINPKMPDGGSGMTTQEAQDYLNALDPAKRAIYDQLATKIDAINASTRQLLVDAGLEKPETIKAWEGAYKHYVPLQREEVESNGLGIGQGFSVKGSASKRAMGSDKAVADILANIAMQRERAIVRAEKNRVAQAVYGLSLKAPNPDFWMTINPAEAKAFSPKQQQTVIDELTSLGLDPADAMNFVKEPTQRYVDPRTGLVAERINPVMRSAPNVLSMRVNGEDRYVFFNAGDERANRMVQALKNLDADQLGRLLQTSAKITRYFSSINTQWNPVFGVVNLTRDVQGALLNLSTTPLRGKEGRVLADTFSALRGIYSDLRAIRKGGAASSQWASLWEEFQKEGGQTGYRDMFANSTERAEAIEKELKKIGEGNAKAGVRAIFDWLSDYNESMENAVRLATYKTAIDQGISKQKAASIAKSITVNFNKKGAVAVQAGAIWAFFNASAQGSFRMLQTLRGPAGRKIILGGLTLGAVQALALAAAGFDDEEPPEFVRERSLIIPTGGGKYIAIPMPLGFHVIPNISRITTEWALSGFKHTPDRVSGLLGLFADTFNPIGGAGLSMQTLAPTALDPLAALAENKDWSGKPIAREDFNSMDPSPGYLRAKDTASALSKAVSYWANLATGGTDYKPGFISPTPDQLDYLIGQVAGGVGREYMKLEQTATSAITGEDLPPHKVPLLGRFYGDTTGQSSEANRFYANVREINLHKSEIEGRRKDGGNVMEYMSDNPTSRLAMGVNRVETQVRKLRKLRRDAIEKGADAERIKMLDDQITATMHNFNARFDSLDR